MRRKTILDSLGVLMILIGLGLYIWPRVAGAGAPYGENDLGAMLGFGLFILGLVVIAYISKD
ncbi:MAG: hypothetical protein ACFFFC_18190 [Candidatus Thorarchaeota archaeon]